MKALDNPKSAIFACNFSFNKMLEVFRSLWIIGGLQPLCRYSSPATPITIDQNDEWESKKERKIERNLLKNHKLHLQQFEFSLSKSEYFHLSLQPKCISLSLIFRRFLEEIVKNGIHIPDKCSRKFPLTMNSYTNAML